MQGAVVTVHPTAYRVAVGLALTVLLAAEARGTVGGAVVWNIWESVQFYGAYRWHSLDRDNEYIDPVTGAVQDDPEDISAVMIGGRIKF